MDWFLYDNSLRLERVKFVRIVLGQNIKIIESYGTVTGQKVVGLFSIFNTLPVVLKVPMCSDAVLKK